MLATNSKVIDFAAARDERAVYEPDFPPDARDPNPTIQSQNLSLMQMRGEIAGAIDYCEAPPERITEAMMDEVMQILSEYYESTDLALQKVIQYAKQGAKWAKIGQKIHQDLEDARKNF